MGWNEESFTWLRHELRTSLNHIMGYSEILQEDAREYELDVIIPELQRIHRSGGEIRDFIARTLDLSSGALEQSLGDVKKMLYRSLYEIIGTAQQIRKSVETAEANSLFVQDLGKILLAANTMLDLIDTRLGDLFLINVTEQNSPSDRISIAVSKQEAAESALGRKVETGTILVVDDNEVNREMLARHLERQGHSVLSVEDGPEALRKLHAQEIDLVILDIMMPIMNGYQVLEAIKNDSNLRHVPVIMISALEETESIARCIEMGAEDYLPKSFDPILLRARIDASLEKKRLRDQERMYVQAILESQKVLAGELADAAEYVRNLLPPPMNGEVKTRWLFIPSAQLGGDSFGYHWLDADKLALYLLDVSGHGIGAALLSVSVMNVLRTQSLPDTDFTDPGMVLSALNTAFPMDLQNNMFFSIWYGVYDRNRRSISYASAGAPPAILLSSDGSDVITRLGTADMIVGLRDDLVYETKESKIDPKSTIYLFSDGAYEIRRPNGKMLHLEEFIEILAIQPRTADCESRLTSVLNQIQGISMSEAFDDDVSILEVRFD